MGKKDYVLWLFTAVTVTLLVYWVLTSKAFGEMKVTLIDSKGKTVCVFPATSMQGVSVPGGVDISISLSTSAPKIVCVSSAPVPVSTPTTPYPGWLKPTPKKGK